MFSKWGYFLNYWNVIDILCLITTALVLLESYQLLGIFGMSSLRGLAAIASCLILSKVFYWLRLFKKRAFYILLLERTFDDSRQFISLIFISLLMFGVPMLILNQNRYTSEDSIIQNDINWWFFDILINQYLLALGEFTSLEAFGKGDQTGLCFFFFFCATFITQITMFNMLIAIMGDTFDHLMENYEVNEIKTQFKLLGDEISVMQTLSKDEVLETFFYVIQPDDLDDDEEKEDSPWYGTITHIRLVIEKNMRDLHKKQQ